MSIEANKPRRYVTADVFSDCMFHGNPVAVLLDAEGLSAAQMQAVAREFNYIESTFVLAPDDPDDTARVRIFTPVREVPFAGHPNIGTAFILAHEAAGRREPPLRRVIFEEAAGLVPIDLLWENDVLVGAELTCPEPFSRRGQVTVEQAAACLSLDPTDIRTADHLPLVVSVGLPFLAVELASRDALRRARPDKAAYAAAGRGALNLRLYSIPRSARDSVRPASYTGKRRGVGREARRPLRSGDERHAANFWRGMKPLQPAHQRGAAERS